MTIVGPFNEFRLDFGDGQFTNLVADGSHTYAPGTTVDPVVTVSNADCQIVLSPTERADPEQPLSTTEDEPFEIPIPECPPFPEFSCTPVDITPPDFEIPPIVFPCIDITVPDFPAISFPDIDITPIIPSVIVFEPPTIEFGPAPDIPTLIEFGPAPTFTVLTLEVDVPTLVEFGPSPFIPTLIEFGPAPFVPTLIEFGESPSIPTMIDFGPAPTPTVDWGPQQVISIEWGTPPCLSFCSCCEFTLSVACPASGAPMAFAPMTLQNEWWDDDWADDVKGGRQAEQAEQSLDPLKSPVDTSALDDINFDLGIPSEIKIVAPESIPAINVIHDIPKVIKVEAPDIPKEIRLMHDLPDKIDVAGIPDSIKLDAPESIKLDAPETIKLDATALPEEIKLIVPPDFPSIIRLDATGIPAKIQVEGIPEVIELVHDLPNKIELVMPENPKVEMVYEGSPIELKIQLDIDSALADTSEGPCVMITPCRTK